MIYEPKMLINKTEKPIEFMCDHRVYQFAPGERKILEGFAAYHALKEVNTGLEELGVVIDSEELKKIEGETVRKPVPSSDYGHYKWLDLRVMAMKRGIHVRNMKRQEVEEALRKQDSV